MRNNNLILVAVISTLSIIVVISTITSVHSQRPDPILTFIEYEDKIIDKKNTKINTTEHVPKFFAIQHAQSGSISEINETTYSLELNDISEKTILFADRPDRIVLSESTSDFIGNWSLGEDSFVVDSPNALLVVDNQDGQQFTAIVEVFNPIYDYNKKVLQYIVTPDNATSIDLPSKFIQTTMIVDARLDGLILN